jgi:hypothetical protein
MAQERTSIAEKLKGCELSAVTFIRDCLQLQFDGRSFSPHLNWSVWPRVTASETTVGPDTPRYRDVLCGQIGKVVAGVFVEADAVFRVFFADGSMIEASLLPEDRPGPEALVLQDGKGGFGVW